MDKKIDIKEIVRHSLTVIVLFQTSVVSYAFFSKFGSSPSWKIFYGFMGVLLDCISVFILNFEKGLIKKTFAYSLVLLSIGIFAAEAFSQAPEIAVENKTYVSTLEESDKLLSETAKALTDSIKKTEGGYGTSNSKVANEVAKIVESKLTIAKTSQEYAKTLNENKEMEIFKIIATKVNVSANSLFIGFLFLRGMLLELALVVLSMKSSNFNLALVFNTLFPKKVKRGRPRGSKTERKEAPVEKAKKTPKTVKAIKTEPSVPITKKRVLKRKVQEFLPDKKLQEPFNIHELPSDKELSEIVGEFDAKATTTKYEDEY